MTSPTHPKICVNSNHPKARLKRHKSQHGHPLTFLDRQQPSEQSNVEKVPAAKNMNSHLAQTRAVSTTPIGLDTVLLAHWLSTLTTLTTLTSLIVRSFLKLLSQSLKTIPSHSPKPGLVLTGQGGKKL